jgi:hypothetical protein
VAVSALQRTGLTQLLETVGEALWHEDAGPFDRRMIEESLAAGGA